MKFEIGDKVRAFGCDGVVVNSCPIVCQFGDEVLGFTSDGKENSWHKEPSLVLVEKARKEKGQASEKKPGVEFGIDDFVEQLIQSAYERLAEPVFVVTPKFVEKTKYLVWMKTKNSGCHYPTDKLPLMLYETKQEAIEQLNDSPRFTAGYTEVKVWVKE